jgi:3-oxoadipate enol-lactonase
MFLKTEDADLFVTAFGPGPRAIVAHGGWVGSGELWVAPFEILSRTWRTVTYDHRGTGATINRAPRITLDLLVSDLFRTLDALGIEECVLAGESSGACVVLEAVLQQPERFSGLVIVDGRYRATGGASVFAEGCRQDFPETMKKFTALCVTDEGKEAELAWALQITMRSSGPAALQLLDCTRDVELESRLAQVRQPTLVIHGSGDRIIPLTGSEVLAQKIPNATLVVIEGAGHVPTMTRPQEVAQAIESFFG